MRGAQLDADQLGRLQASLSAAPGQTACTSTPTTWIRTTVTSRASTSVKASVCAGTARLKTAAAASSNRRKNTARWAIIGPAPGLPRPAARPVWQAGGRVVQGGRGIRGSRPVFARTCLSHAPGADYLLARIITLSWERARPPHPGHPPVRLRPVGTRPGPTCASLPLLWTA